jgi:hypothetical protein
MYEGRRLHDWTLAGNMLCLLANCNRDPKVRRRPFSITDFVPPDLCREFTAARRSGMTVAALRALKPLLAER